MDQYRQRRGFVSWFVEPYRQVKLGLLFLLLNLLFAGLTLGLFGYYIRDISQALTVYFQLNGEESLQVFEKLQAPVYACAALMMAFVIASILISVRYTHQIHGPLVSIHRFLNDHLNGQPVQPLILRESDQLQELAEKLNQALYVNSGDRRASNLQPFLHYLDELLEGGQPEPLKLQKDDRFYPLAERLHQVGQRLRGNRVG